MDEQLWMSFYPRRNPVQRSAKNSGLAKLRECSENAQRILIEFSMIISWHKSASLALQKVQINPFIGLQDMVNVELPIAGV